MTASAAALLLGATGYARQGSPDLPDARAQAGRGRDVFPLTDARHAFYGHFTPAESWLRMSEALARDGKSEDAVGILQNAVKKYPGDAQLWVGLGNALVDHARGMTPPAELAYRRAAQVSPGYPGPPFFMVLRWPDPATGRTRSSCGNRSWRQRRQTQAGGRWWSRALRL